MKREDLRVGGVYKHCKYPLFIACISLGERGSLEGMALNNYNDIHQGDMCRSWFIPSFEPFDISLSLEQGECKEVIKGGDLNHWRKVDEELPENEDGVIVKIKVDSDICSFDIARYDKLYKTFYSTSYCVDSSFEDCGNVIEWKPID